MKSFPWFVLIKTKRLLLYANNLNGACDGRLSFVQANAFRYRPDQQHEIVWSAGLFDYLDDKQFVFLLRRLYEMVKPGGELVVGNFGPDNPSRNYMEFGQWFLKHRSTEELINLGRQCGVRAGQIRVEAESAGVNLFLRIEKE
jgi:SAM-dependent methyltransferase